MNPEQTFSIQLRPSLSLSQVGQRSADFHTIMARQSNDHGLSSGLGNWIMYAIDLYYEAPAASLLRLELRLFMKAMVLVKQCYGR